MGGLAGRNDADDRGDGGDGEACGGGKAHYRAARGRGPLFCIHLHDMFHAAAPVLIEKSAAEGAAIFFPPYG